MNHRIGELNEQPLHAALKEWYVQPGDQVEVQLDGYYIDLVRGERLIEIQTGGISTSWVKEVSGPRMSASKAIKNCNTKVKSTALIKTAVIYSTRLGKRTSRG